MSRQSYILNIIKNRFINIPVTKEEFETQLDLNYKNKNVKKIINIFQKKYVNAKGNGFGDFLRGSFFLLQFCSYLKLDFDVDYQNHIISEFFYKKDDIMKENCYDIDYNNIMSMIGVPIRLNIENYNKFIDFLNLCNNENYYLYSNSKELLPITDDQINIIKNKFLPNELLEKSINKTFENLELIENQFKVIHLRIGDKFIISNETDNNLFKMIEEILADKINTDCKYLILSDSNELKNYLKDKFSNLIIISNEIIHTGEEIQNITIEDEYISTKNTLVEFFIMSKSNFIYCISVYGHGSGFSEYCSVLFNIKYEMQYYKI
jgi:hypothetical protein